MTREEAIKHLSNDLFVSAKGQLCVDVRKKDEFMDAIGISIDALRPVSRERVETAWKGKWQYYPEGCDELTWACSRCGEAWTLIDGTPDDNNMNFCHACGAPMTDEAVEMVMERLEQIKCKN